MQDILDKYRDNILTLLIKQNVILYLYYDKLIIMMITDTYIQVNV